MRAGEGQEGIERQLAEERAAALVRISRTLESLIEALHAARAQIDAAPRPARDADIAAYRQLRQRAMRYRWYLEVQREALGLRRHHRLDEFYPIPGPI